jgi:hypothetical protein
MSAGNGTNHKFVPFFLSRGVCLANQETEPMKKHQELLGPEVIRPTNGVEPLVTTEELASHLRCTPRTIASYRADRRIPFIRITPRRILYRVSDVEAQLAKQKNRRAISARNGAAKIPPTHECNKIQDEIANLHQPI